MKNLKPIVLFLPAFLIFAGQLFGQAPILVTPSNSNNTWFTNSNALDYLNTAAISYGTNGSIFASVYFDGTSSSTIHIVDPAVGTCNIAIAGSISVEPDVIIGNWDGVSSCSSCTSSATDYIMAVAYNSGGTLEIDYYDIYDDRSSTITATLLGSTTPFPLMTIGQIVHMDVIAEYGNTGTTGLPFCNKFVVTFNYNVVYAAYGDLNSETVGAAQTICPAGRLGDRSDVAAIQRSGFLAPNPIHNFALVTYLENSNRLVYREWDITGSTLSALSTLDNGSTSNSIGFPRIDAYDDYNVNSSSSIAKYEIVAAANNLSGMEEIRNYDNLQTGNILSGNVDISGVSGYTSYTPPYNNYNPSVACGTNYMVSHYTEYAANSDIVFMEPVSPTSPTLLAGNKYYWVNGNGAPANVDASTCDHITSISTPPNNIGLNSVLAWAFYNGTNYEVDYKLTAAPYSYKQSPAGQSAYRNEGWQLYPNPAANELNIRGDNGTMQEYQITDMAGRVLAHGMTADSKVDISELSSGTYIFKLLHSEAGNAGKLFIKQ